MAATRPRRPAGFGFLAGCALLCAGVMALGLADGGSDLDFPLVSRFALAATGALALVTAEALAFVRPWAYGASLALAGSFVATMFVLGGGYDVGFVMIGVSALPILIALSIVYNGMHPAPRIRPGPHPPRVP